LNLECGDVSPLSTGGWITLGRGISRGNLFKKHVTATAIKDDKRFRALMSHGGQMKICGPTYAASCRLA
jgi:hypothetical protein